MRCYFTQDAHIGAVAMLIDASDVAAIGRWHEGER